MVSVFCTGLDCRIPIPEVRPAIAGVELYPDVIEQQFVDLTR